MHTGYDVIPDLINEIHYRPQDSLCHCHNVIPYVRDDVHEAIPGGSPEIHNRRDNGDDSLINQDAYRDNGDQDSLAYGGHDFHELIPARLKGFHYWGHEIHDSLSDLRPDGREEFHYSCPHVRDNL